MHCKDLIGSRQTTRNGLPATLDRLQSREREKRARPRGLKGKREFSLCAEIGDPGAHLFGMSLRRVRRLASAAARVHCERLEIGDVGNETRCEDGKGFLWKGSIAFD